MLHYQLGLTHVAMQDADCRGDVLDVMLAVVRRGRYTASQLSTMLQAATESVPLQKFQVHPFHYRARASHPGQCIQLQRH